MIITYQDLLKVKEKGGEKELISFVRSSISSYKSSDAYKEAEEAREYYRHRNVTITKFKKVLYDITGKSVPDIWSANFKMCCRHFHRFIVQENQFLLGNGVNWNDESTTDKLGTKKYPFDTQLQRAGTMALWGGVSFGFWNLDHVDVFSALEFIPLFDEENGSLRAGIRFWQIDDLKPLRAVLYEEDGYTGYIWKNEKEGKVYSEKRNYVLSVQESEIDGQEIYDGENYPTFPIVPLWGNPEHQSEIVGLREQIDCYDLIKSGFANDVDDASLIYWIIQNAGGMDDVDLAQFLDRLRTVHAAVMDDGMSAEPHSQEPPYASREALLNRLDADLYRDAMALDVERIASGAATATQIVAAYEALNSKCDDYEYCVHTFIQGILDLAGIEDEEATFTRSMIVNSTELIGVVIQSAQFLSSDYVTEKILNLLGDGDRLEDVLRKMEADALGRLSLGMKDASGGETPPEGSEGPEEATEATGGVSGR